MGVAWKLRLAAGALWLPFGLLGASCLFGFASCLFFGLANDPPRALHGTLVLAAGDDLIQQLAISDRFECGERRVLEIAVEAFC